MAYFYYLFTFHLEKKLIKIKILYTIPNFDTAGSGKALLNVAKNLDKSRFEPHICCFHSRGYYFKEVQKSGIPVHIKKTTHEMIPRIKGIKNSYKLSKFFKTLDIDLIHSFHYGDDYSEVLAARMAGIPWVYTKKNMNWGGNSKNSWIIRTFLAKHILAQNTDMIRLFFSKSKKVTLVPRGVDTKEFAPRMPNEKILKKFNIKEGDKVIICVANLHPVKGVETLIDAFLEIVKHSHSFHLFIVGFNDNKIGNFLKNKVNESGREKNIYFTGKVKNVKSFLSVSDLFILPSIKEGRGEGCPVALLEALSSGLKVLGGDASGIKNILRPFPENIFESGNVGQLKRKIEEQLKLEGIDKKQELLEYTIKNYDIMVEAKNHESVYLNLLSDKI